MKRIKIYLYIIIGILSLSIILMSWNLFGKKEIGYQEVIINKDILKNK